jgi:rfaE bifunctional protein nucleotidyltransferase chain/domain
MKVVLCHGCWDGLHPGHLRHLEAAKRYGDRLIVSVTTDAWVRKGPGRPYIPETLRAELVGALRCVDQVMLTNGNSAAELIRLLKPAVFAKGHDYAPGTDPRTRDEAAALATYGGLMLFTPAEVVFASTRIFAESGIRYGA